MSANASADDWQLSESGERDAEHTVLLLAGAMVTAATYEGLIAESALREASIRLVAATLPGFGRTTYPSDLSIDNYAVLAADLAAELRADAVAGHSMGANVAIEMAAANRYAGPLVLLSPSFSRQDEPRFPRAVDGLAHVFGRLPWSATLKVIGLAIKDEGLPPGGRDRLVADMKNNDPRFLAASYRRYLEYLDSQGSIVARLCGSGVPALVVFGEHDDVGLTDLERLSLESCPRVMMRTIAGTGHLLPMERPDLVAGLITATFTPQGWRLPMAA